MGGARTVPNHYLRGNETVWTPPQVISLDTETRWVGDGQGETHVLRLWAAQLDSRRPDSSGWTGSDTAWGRTAGQLAAQINEWAAGQKCVWLFAHNLSFDLTVSRLPAEMGKLGWAVSDHAAGSETPWLRLSRGGRSITLADSWGWLRQSIGEVGNTLGIPKPELPGNGDSEAGWLARCQGDVTILATAMCQIMDWWDTAELGRWSVTGSHSGWNVMRHLSPRRRIVVMVNETGIQADRAAIYGGRRECFTWGDLNDGPFTELDFSAAYPQIAANLPLPAKRLYQFDSLPLDSPLVRGDGLGIIAQVEIETDIPRWPCRVGNRVWYPIGRFTTTLAGPEIAEAYRLGCLRAVGPGWAHAMGWSLRPWAQWILDSQNGENAGMPPVARPMVKHWGRATIGKFAAKGFTKVDYGGAPGDVWTYESVWDIEAQAHGSVVTLGGRRWKCLATQSGDNCYPAILAYIESHVRARLSRVIDAAGPGQVICCDTDGVTGRTAGGLDAAAESAGTWPLVMRPKGQYNRMQVLGPQHLIKDGRRSYSGVPNSAVKQPDGSLHALVWPRLAWQLKEHAGDGYRRPVQTYVLGASYASGWVDTDGAVLAVEVQLGPDGGNVAQTWQQGKHRAAGRQLGEVQAPSVDRIFGR